jgi:hypothetical protein
MSIDQQQLVHIYNLGTLISFIVIGAILFFIITGRTVFSFFCNCKERAQDLDKTNEGTMRNVPFRSLTGESVYIPFINYPDSKPLLCVDISEQTTSLPPRFLLEFGDKVGVGQPPSLMYCCITYGYL